MIEQRIVESYRSHPEKIVDRLFAAGKNHNVGLLKLRCIAAEAKGDRGLALGERRNR